MVDVQSATAEIRRGKKRKMEPQGKNIMYASATQIGDNWVKFVKFLVPGSDSDVWVPKAPAARQMTTLPLTFGGNLQPWSRFFQPGLNPGVKSNPAWNAMKMELPNFEF